MNHNHIHNDPTGDRSPFWKSKYSIALVMVAAIVLFYFLREHWKHIGGNWIYLLILLCPLMHLFGCGRHDHRKHGPVEGDRRKVDLVSGESVDPEKAPNSTYKGQTYYFASRENRDRFEASPDQYVQEAKDQQPKQAHQRHGCC